MLCTFEGNFAESESFLNYVLHPITFLELPIHLFGAYIIVFHTPKRMSGVKYAMIYLHFWSAFFDINVSLLLTPYMLVPLPAGYCLGLLTLFGVSTAVQCYYGISCFAVMAVAILVFFENRYNALVVGHKAVRRKFLRIVHIAMNYVLACSFLLPNYANLPDPEKGKEFARSVRLETHLQSSNDDVQKLPCLPESVINHDNFFTLELDVWVISVTVAATIVLLASQSFYFVIRIIAYFLSNRTSSHSTKRLQKTFFIALCIQVSIPLAVLILPLSSMMYSFWFDHFNQAANNFCFVAISAHGLLSTIVMLCVHRPYRQKTLSMLFGQRIGSSAVQSTSVLLRHFTTG